MNREITTKKVGRQKKLTNPCPVIKGRSPRYKWEGMVQGTIRKA